MSYYTYLVETNIVGVFTEALTANVKVVLADQSGSVGADAAIFTHWQVFVSQSGLYYSMAIYKGHIPLTRALAILTGTGVPDVAVGHVG